MNSEKSYVLHFQGTANGKAGPADVFARKRTDGSVLISRHGNLLVETDLRKISKAFAAKLEESEEEVRSYIESEWNIAQTELLNAKEQAESAEQADDPIESGPPSAEALLAAMPQDAVHAARAMLADPKLLSLIVEDLAAFGIAGERALAATVFFVGVSRLLDRPLSGIIQGSSSSGKSHIIERTSLAFPPETIILATQMTPQALFHMPAGALIHKFIVAGERSRIDDDDRAEATRALREMQSAGRLSKLMPVKGEGGKIETVSIEQEGPIAFIESTTLGRIFDEDANRCILLHTDERSEQTKQVVNLVAAVASGNQAAPSQLLIDKHHALQRLLKPMPVLVPFAQQLADRIECERVEVRRAFPQLLTLIQTSALLHQYQRQIDRDGRLLAEKADYEIARKLLLKPMARLLGGSLSDPAKRFYERLREWAVNEHDEPILFVVRDVKSKGMGNERASKSSINNWLTELLDTGLVEVVNERKGRKAAEWRLTEQTLEEPANPVLPNVVDVFGEK